VTLAPEMPEAQYGLGISYLQNNQPKEAIAALKAFLAIEIPPGCVGDQGLGAEAREQAEEILRQLEN